MTSTPPTPAARQSRLPAWLRALRPKQWVKNVLVVAAPLAAGRLFEPAVALATLWAMIAFCLVSAAIYVFNDIRDVAADRQHPTKRLRPIAAGELSPRIGYLLAAVCLAAGLALGTWTSPQLGVTLAIYVVLQVAYSLFFKHQPIIDLAMVAAGFLL
ncbi:MAG: UbiA family prenyltransferase, partial [Propionicimonas sp.]|nr:UbiA family prenyltransferase [Propionicimonas sp.]